ncbi:MAG: ABC-F family ATP-binding cassette domain-containing protein [Prevotellaceae bacterium]|jgi:ATP-binding cassette subfamily F protein uup|nr:ABC-F family ATP-binding cassette domain-containing protein [Prevotellaceae bacterium]
MINYLQVEELTKSYGNLVLFNNISFSIGERQRVGLIGKNGSGKTSLLNIIVGNNGCDSGKITFKRDLRVGYLEQDPVYPTDLTVLEACFYSDNDVVKVISKYERIMQSDNHKGLDEILSQMDHLKAWNYEQRVKQILTQLKITSFNQKIGELSRGQLKRVALANVLITEPELLILDEPTNHLDLEMTEWLEEYLQHNNMSLLMVTHDRYFLDRVCSSILEIDRKQIYPYKGNYSYYLEKRQERIDNQNAEVERANNLLRKELDWMRRQPQARATKAQYRIKAFYELEERAKQQHEQGNVKLDVKASYIGKKIFEAKHVSKSYGDLKILKDFNYIFLRYEKMGIVGNNGTGKTTFIKMLLGLVQPDSGEFDIGETVNFSYYSQDGLQFDEQMKVIDVVQDIAEVVNLGNGKQLSASQFLQHFLFTPETQHNYVYKLSGGEKRRLYLCTVLIKNPNFLVLDEPTNDLDIVTLNVLEEYLQSFQGCVIVVSHDRYFMDKVVDHLLVFKGNADIKDFPGSYTDYRDGKEEQGRIEKERESLAHKAVKAEQEMEPDKFVSEKKKLSYKEQKEFEALETEIPLLEVEKASLETELSSGTLSSDKLITKSNRIAELIKIIDEKTMRWIELSEHM